MSQRTKPFLLLLLMLLSAGVAILIRPTHRIADQKPPISLEKIIPTSFGNWHEVESSMQQIVNPEEQKVLIELYSQTLSKTYTNSNGYRVMLSVAYGGDQSRDLGVHRPEVCYSAQGFQLANQEKITLNIGGMAVPAMRMQTQLGARYEPVMYWIRVGDKLVRGNLELGFARLSYGVKGQIADGVLFRVSSIDMDAEAAFKQQEQFVRDLNNALHAEDKQSIFGALGAPRTQ